MRVLWCFLLVLLVSSLAAPGPEPEPEPSLAWSRIRRAAQFIKGHKTTRAPIHLNLRKGEYICGNKICSLRRGEVPPHCDGVCQYKV